MNTFKQFFLLREAIRLKDARKRKLGRKYGGAYKIPVLNDVFKDRDRLIYDIDIDNSEAVMNNEIFKKVKSLLEQKGYSLKTAKDYIEGLANDNRNQKVRIGKILNNLATSGEGDQSIKDLSNSFRDDSLRNAKGKSSFKVVISRHPYDIAGMSTDRSWTSCMNLGLKPLVYPVARDKGMYHHYVTNDISKGSIVAYLITGDDINKNGTVAIRRPLTRILMKPYFNVKAGNSNDIAYSLGRIYGSSNDYFVKFLQNWLVENINTNTKGKSYNLAQGLYSDHDQPINFKISKANDVLTEAFDNIISTNIHMTDSKDDRAFNNINIQNLQHEQHGCELIVKFPIPLNIKKLPNFSYDLKLNRASLPDFISDIVNSISLSNTMRHFIYSDVDDNSITVSYIGYLDEDQFNDKNYINDRYDTIDLWENLLRKSLRLHEFNWEASFKDIKDIVKDFDTIEERKKQLDELKIAFARRLDDNINLVNSIENSALPNALEAVNNVKTFLHEHDISNLEKLNNLLNDESTKRQITYDYEYPVLHENMDTIVRFSQMTRILIDNLSINIPISRSFLIGECKDVWYRMIGDYFTRKGYNKVYEFLKDILKLNDFISSNTHGDITFWRHMIKNAYLSDNDEDDITI